MASIMFVCVGWVEAGEWGGGGEANCVHETNDRVKFH